MSSRRWGGAPTALQPIQLHRTTTGTAAGYSVHVTSFFLLFLRDLLKSSPHHLCSQKKPLSWIWLSPSSKFLQAIVECIPFLPLPTQHSARLEIECPYLKSSPTRRRFAASTPVSVLSSRSGLWIPFDIFGSARIFQFCNVWTNCLKGLRSNSQRDGFFKLWQQRANTPSVCHRAHTHSCIQSTRQHLNWSYRYF